MPALNRLEYGTLDQTLALLAGIGVIPQAGAMLEASMQQAGNALREAVLAEIPAFSASGNPEILPALERHGTEHIREVCRLFGGGTTGDFDFVRSHARLRAEQRFPLEAMLHAYRCGHRVVSRWLRDAAIAVAPGNSQQAITAVAEFSIEYTNIISTVTASEYVSCTRLLAEAEGDLRTELLTILLSGYDESDGRVARLLKRAGYLEQRQSYCVVVAQSANASEMENPARAQRIASAVSDAVANSSIRVLAGIRNNLVVAILSDRRRLSGWTAPQAALADRISPLLLVLGPAVAIGISADHPSTSFIPKALHEAMIAFDFAGTAKRVVQFSGLPIRTLLVHRGSDYVRSAAPNWVAELVNADGKAKGALIATLRVLAGADLNVQEAGRQLGVHPNTVYARVDRIQDLTGLDGRRHHDLVELLLAADCWKT